MQLRFFGDGAQAVSVVGFGGWPIGSDSYGCVTDSDALEAIRVALNRGVTLFDTAPCYGDGRSESILGRELKSHRSRLLFSTKAGYVDYATRRQDFSTRNIRRSLEASIRRLSSDYVDFLFLHSPPPEVIAGQEAYDALATFKEEGLVRFVGASVRSPEDGSLALGRHPFDAIQVTLNASETQAVSSGFLALALSKRTCVLVKSPLAGGFLAGKYCHDSRFSGSDRRSRLSRDEREALLAGLGAVLAESRAGRVPPACAAIRFVLSQPGVTAALVGMKSAKQVLEDSLGAAAHSCHRWSAGGAHVGSRSPGFVTHAGP